MRLVPPVTNGIGFVMDSVASAGRGVSVRGVVVDVSFADGILPDINTALGEVVATQVMFETGIKVIGLLAPMAHGPGRQGGKAAMFGGARHKNVLLLMDNVFRFVQAMAAAHQQVARELDILRAAQRLVRQEEITAEIIELSAGEMASREII